MAELYLLTFLLYYKITMNQFGRQRGDNNHVFFNFFALLSRHEKCTMNCLFSAVIGCHFKKNVSI